VAAIVKGAGYRLGDKRLQGVSPSVYTGNERASLVAAGFHVLTATKYLTSGDYLLAGDINLNERTHTNICVTNGSKSGATTDTKLDVDGWIGTKTVTKWQQVMGTYVDGIISGQSELDEPYLPNVQAIEYDGGGSQLVRAIQRATGATIDGYMGKNTVTAIQRRLGVSQDGYLGPETAKAIQKRLNEGRF
jgi:peptidoglycan hydrolase-like protein with peptidoglycan-binding domain